MLSVFFEKQFRKCVKKMFKNNSFKIGQHNGTSSKQQYIVNILTYINTISQLTPFQILYLWYLYMLYNYLLN
jgi:hypothetical protein